ncbi:MAG: hypothetical protein Q4A40_06225 [Bacillota bacterium]|nr:hypothetical protein [Bacillota bacterium]
MNAIVTVDEDRGTGKNNDLLCHLPGGLRYPSCYDMADYEYTYSDMI